MKVLLVDNDSKGLATFLESASAKYPGAMVIPYIDPMLAAVYAANNAVDVLICEKNMRRIDGNQLAEIVKKFNPDAEIAVISRESNHEEEVSEDLEALVALVNLIRHDDESSDVRLAKMLRAAINKTRA